MLKKVLHKKNLVVVDFVCWQLANTVHSLHGRCRFVCKYLLTKHPAVMKGKKICHKPNAENVQLQKLHLIVKNPTFLVLL